ncbi:hypothetical protein LCL87_15950 [Rhodococcus hoagii]|nr:hypothetical protein [Prescottella equi]
MTVPSDQYVSIGPIPLARLPLSVAALLVSSAWSPLPGTEWLLVALVLGFVLGTKIFHTLNQDRYESSVLSLLIVAALVSSVTAFS